MKIIILDDDPTGSQTVYDSTLILDCSFTNIKNALLSDYKLIFLLINTRSMSESNTELKLREISKYFKRIFDSNIYQSNQVIFVSRGDSTLRGHGYLEPRILGEELGPFNATFYIPAFIEGGRTTVNGVHYLNKIPVHETIFAKDSNFGYTTSVIKDWLEFKSKGQILADNVLHISIKFLETAINSKHGFKDLIDFMNALDRNVSVVVDAEDSKHLYVFGKAIRSLHPHKRFLFRSAASFINGLISLPNNPYDIEDLVSTRRKNSEGRILPGMIVIGSYVKLSDDQLEVLLSDQSCKGVELPVQKIAEVFLGLIPESELVDLKYLCVKNIEIILDSFKTPVLYTSRLEIVTSNSIDKNLEFGFFVAEFLASIVKEFKFSIGYVISKGGNSTQVLLSNGLDLSTVILKGQILPGLSLVIGEINNIKLPIITFPGNLGDKYTLIKAWRIMENK
tara:strand:+ start:613 stop:1965 length:1353 start_codon:yes stop_codon:yes gene_type:complete